MDIGRADQFAYKMLFFLCGRNNFPTPGAWFVVVCAIQDPMFNIAFLIGPDTMRRWLKRLDAFHVHIIRRWPGGSWTT
jgi:hypothetical protein